MYVTTPDEMRRIDNRAIEEFGIPGAVLMENAAIRTVNVIEEKYPALFDGGRVIILAGCGNNGGDGLAIGRHLMLKGAKVQAFLFFAEEKFTGNARLNLDIYKRLGGHIELVTHEEDIKTLKGSIYQADLIVDSIFGTGITRDIDSLIYKAVDMVNKSPVPVVAVDIPSGINGKDGRIMGIAIKAQHTVSFGYPKRGHILYPGREYTGRLHVVPISLPQDSSQAVGVKTFTLDDKEMAQNLMERPRQGHKGTFGKVGVIAGSLGMAGAACLTSMAALKGGSGLVTLGCPASLVPIFQSKMTEVMCYPLEDGQKGYLTLDAITGIRDFLKDKDVLAIGPGLGSKCDGLEIIRYILREFDISIIMDADALNHISRDKRLLSDYKGSIVITPHPGEMARLTGKSIQEIVASPIETATEFARDMGIIVLLKGAVSIVAHPEGNIYLNSSGNAGMGTGGSGDVLTGLIASMVAQGYSPYDAAVYGCYIHGRAGDYAREKWGETGMIAGNLLDELPLVFKDLFSLKG
ncbi:MAG: NAD(P)H-hydrate dehydratase [Caldicoprobacterales bacterium]|nr:NAD(P)H-hydrate dehydratase [Clostridiales bacterium]